METKGSCYLVDSPASGLAMTKDEIRKDFMMKEVIIYQGTHSCVP